MIHQDLTAVLCTIAMSVLSMLLAYIHACIATWRCSHLVISWRPWPPALNYNYIAIYS